MTVLYKKLYTDKEYRSDFLSSHRLKLSISLHDKELIKFIGDKITDVKNKILYLKQQEKEL